MEGVDEEGSEEFKTDEGETVEGCVILLGKSKSTTGWNTITCRPDRKMTG